MCGIVAYIGKKEAYPIVLKGLKRLEYRGYDSSGIALLKNEEIKLFKKEGKVLNLENHVEAKRYLCVAKPGYHKKLSEASLKTLAFQGGPMSEDEVAAFEANPYYKDFVKVRAWDEMAKVENKPLTDLERYKEMAKNHLRNRN